MTDRNCLAELCPNWPGEGCLRGVVDCPEPDAEDQDRERAWMAGWYDDRGDDDA